MLAPLFHRLVARPAVYDLVQAAAGEGIIRRWIGRRVRPFRSARFVLDLGGGTGLYRSIWSGASRYCCLDLDAQKLAGFRHRHPAEPAIQADATRLPFGDQALDAVICTFVAHHIDDALLPRFFCEAARALKPQGKFVFAEPIWSRWRIPARLLWRYDRGAFPRSEARLLEMLGQHFTIESFERLALWHDYRLCIARPLDMIGGVGSRE